MLELSDLVLPQILDFSRETINNRCKAWILTVNVRSGLLAIIPATLHKYGVTGCCHVSCFEFCDPFAAEVVGHASTKVDIAWLRRGSEGAGEARL